MRANYLLQSRMLLHTVMRRGNEEVVRKKKIEPVTMTTEKRQGNKIVTKLTKLEDFLIDPEAIAGRLKKVLAGAANTEELPGSGKGLAVVVQGDHTDRISTILMEEYGVPRKFVPASNKKKKSKG